MLFRLCHNQPYIFLPTDHLCVCEYSLRRWLVVSTSCLPPSIFVSTHDYHKHSRIASPIFLQAHFCSHTAPPFWESKLVFEWPKRITQSKFFILFSSRSHGGQTWRLRRRLHHQGGLYAAEETCRSRQPSCYEYQPCMPSHQLNGTLL